MRELLLLTVVLCLALGCASVEELVAEGDRWAAAGQHAKASELYWQAYHKNPEHPLVIQRIGRVKPKPPTHV